MEKWLSVILLILIAVMIFIQEINYKDEIRKLKDIIEEQEKEIYKLKEKILITERREK